MSLALVVFSESWRQVRPVFIFRHGSLIGREWDSDLIVAHRHWGNIYKAGWLISSVRTRVRISKMLILQGSIFFWNSSAHRVSILTVIPANFITANINKPDKDTSPHKLRKLTESPTNSQQSTPNRVSPMESISKALGSNSPQYKSKKYKVAWDP